MAGGFPLSALWWRPVVTGSSSALGVRWLWLPNFGDSRNDLPGHPDSIAGLVPRHVVGDWTMLHKLRRAMVRPGRDLLTGRIEVDESYVGGEEEGLPGRLNLKKALIVVAAQEDDADRALRPRGHAFRYAVSDLIRVQIIIPRPRGCSIHRMSSAVRTFDSRTNHYPSSSTLRLVRGPQGNS